jgi:hypothetical protein
MIISDLRTDGRDPARRVEATIEWEEYDREPEVLYFEADEAHPAPLSADADAFLVAALLSAFNRGERRVRVDAAVCPMLVDQLRAPLQTIAAWYPEMGKPPVIEARHLEASPPAGQETLSLLSCGIDSLATLRANRAWLPRSHPLSIDSCLLVDFVKGNRETGETAPSPDADKIEAALRVVDDADAGVMAVRSNAWWVERDGWNFLKSSFGALFLSTAHALGRSFSHAIIAASTDARHPCVPAGSSPLLDPFYSSSRMQVHHHGTYMSRLEKTALVADWPVGLDNIRVCVHDVRGKGNCGTCEKCIRTMLTLVALGKLDRSAAFDRDDVDEELLQTVIEYKMVWVSNLRDAYRELIPLLQRRERADLVAGIEAIAEDFELRAAAGDPEIIPG